MASQKRKTIGNWETWEDPAEFHFHNGQTVEVRRVGEQNIFFRGKIAQYTDILAGPGILQHGNYGKDTSGNSIIGALAPPGAPIMPFFVSPRRSFHQTSFREGLAVPTAEQYERYQQSLIELRKTWRERFRKWAAAYEFRIVSGRPH